MKRLLPLILLVFAAAACNTSGCYDNRNSIPLAGLYSYETLQKITLNTLMIYGIGAPGDSVLVNSGTGVSEIYLPMRSTADNVSWVFHYTQADISGLDLNDTISFDYTSHPYFASEECGASYRYRITGCRWTKHLIDSLAITDSLITNVDIVRIQIFMRTSQPSDPNLAQ